MLEWLKTVLGEAYTDDIDKKVSDEIGKNFVARADFNAKLEEIKTLHTQIGNSPEKVLYSTTLPMYFSFVKIFSMVFLDHTSLPVGDLIASFCKNFII